MEGVVFKANQFISIEVDDLQQPTAVVLRDEKGDAIPPKFGLVQRAEITWSSPVGDAVVFIKNESDNDGNGNPVGPKKRRSLFNRFTFAVEKDQEVITRVKATTKGKGYEFGVLLILDNSEGSLQPVLDPRIIIN